MIVGIILSSISTKAWDMAGINLTSPGSAVGLLTGLKGWVWETNLFTTLTLCYIIYQRQKGQAGIGVLWHQSFLKFVPGFLTVYILDYIL